MPDILDERIRMLLKRGKKLMLCNLSSFMSRQKTTKKQLHILFFITETRLVEFSTLLDIVSCLLSRVLDT